MNAISSICGAYPILSGVFVIVVSFCCPLITLYCVQRWIMPRPKSNARTKHYKLADANRIDSLLDGINALRIDGYSIRKAAIKIAPDYEWLAWKMVDRVNKIENIYYYQTKARKNDASAKKNM